MERLKKLNNKIVTVGLLIFYFICIVGTYWLGRLGTYIWAKIFNSTQNTSYFSCATVGMAIEIIILLILAMSCLLHFVITTKPSDDNEGNN